MRLYWGIASLLTAAILFSSSAGASGKAELIKNDPASAVNSDDLVPVPQMKPESDELALLNVMSAPLPQKRPANIDLPPGPLATGLLSLRDLRLYREAFAAADARNWQQAREIAARATYKLPAKIIDWRWMIGFRTTASFEQITTFIKDNPKWPLQQYLRRRAEEALDTPVSAEKTLDWFATEPPASGIGMLRYGEALINQGRKAEGINWIKQAWTTGYFTNEVESDILVRHKGLLTRIDHEKRLDHLLWERNIGAATRLFPYVGSGAEKLAVARIRLMKNEGNVDSAVRAVPADLQNDPGLIFERAKWRRKQSLDKGSLELLLQMDSAVPRADKWWRERHIQARNLLLKGQISDAYQLASRHGLDQGADFAAAEWLSGWIALRFQNDGKKALQHFLRLYENVSYPISRARAAYWIGRAQASLSDPDMAQYWYKIAARDYTTYYGQMALHELGQEDLPTIPKVTKPDDREVKALGMTEQVTAVRNLAELDMPFWAKSFLLHMAETVTKEESYVYLARLATKIDRPDYAIAIAKRASQLGTDLTEINWPTPSLKKRHDPPIEPALTLAITRQESAFAADAVSGAGARGLMQLMPATAEAVSRQLNVAYSKNRLTDDPVYNTQLGSSYLAGLIDEFEGSYVLAIAAYNAGPRNVRNWLRDSGDPRSDDIDVIDWIELIPFSETRNYVQRVMENLQIYRQRLTPKQVSQLQINRDINRGVVIQ